MRPIRGQVVVLFPDGKNNSGREPYIELELARKNGVRVYLIGVELQSNPSEQLAFAIPMTGGEPDSLGVGVCPAPEGSLRCLR